jgi:hypothetical protein
VAVTTNRYDITTDDEIVNTLRSKEVNANENEYDVDEEGQNIPSYRDAFQALDLNIFYCNFTQ